MDEQIWSWTTIAGNKGNRSECICSCGVNLWGKPGLNIVCGECEKAFGEDALRSGVSAWCAMHLVLPLCGSARSAPWLQRSVGMRAPVVHPAVDSRWRGPYGQPDGQPDGQAAPAHRLPTRLTTLAHSDTSVRANVTSDV